MPDNPDAIGEPLTEMDEFWLETARAAVQESVSSLEEAAKQLIGAVTLVEGIYFAAVSWSDMKTIMAVAGWSAFFRIALFVSPIVLWLACLFFATRVFTPETYQTNLSSPDLAEQFHRNLVRYKHENLKKAHSALLAGFGLMLAAVVYYLWLLDGPAA
ncbi:MAG: hypothetical protein ACP5OU_08605 [Methanothrix sp.]